MAGVLTPELDQYKVGKHFRLKITASSFQYERKDAKIKAEADLDGIYVVRTSVPSALLHGDATVAAYKRLSTVERAFRSLKTVDLNVRPIFHHAAADRVRTHVFLCMLSYYVEWHMRQRLAPILFDDHDRNTAQKSRRSIVAPAERSPAANKKAQEKRTDDDFSVHSFQTLLQDLATLTKNYVRAGIEDSPLFVQYTKATRLQSRAFELLNVTPKTVGSTLRASSTLSPETQRSSSPSRLAKLRIAHRRTASLSLLPHP